jgi:hypothetical protein
MEVVVIPFFLIINEKSLLPDNNKESECLSINSMIWQYISTSYIIQYYAIIDFC